MITNPLIDRTTSGFPISIGTALAMESLFVPREDPYDPSRVIPEWIEVKNYKEIYISLSTLIRNMVGAMPRELLPMVKADHLVDVLEFEIEIINSLFENEGHNLCKPVYYYCTYEKLFTKKHHQAVRFRLDQTESQHFMTNLLKEAMRLFFFKHKQEGYIYTDSELKPKTSNASMILTHVPYDLLNYTNFQKLDLLESHTGKLKPRNMWYTKYYSVGKEELNTLPFLRKLLLIFGDSVLIQPMDIRFRRMILETSRNRRWTPLTSEEKVKFDLDLDIKERYLFDMFMHL